jgi:hypothetical protein
MTEVKIKIIFDMNLYKIIIKLRKPVYFKNAIEFFWNVLILKIHYLLMKL